MAIYYYCSRIMPNTKSWDDLNKLLNLDLEGKRRKITYISGCIDDKSKSKSYRNGASKNLSLLDINMENFTLLYKNYKETSQKGEVNYNNEQIIEQILEADVVYLLGGNPQEQINYIKNNNLDTILCSYEGIIIGVSSGAMTMSKNVIIPPCGEKYSRDYISSGLGLTSLNVLPHFDYHLNHEKFETKDGYILVSSLLKISYEHKILGLPNETIIRCTENEIFLMGEQPYLLSEGNIYDTYSTEEKIDNIKVKKLTLTDIKNEK